jgi:predicted nucleic acid-binding protein
MKAVFADTYFYLALLSRDAAARAKAEEVAGRTRVPTVTSSFVLMEVANALSAPAHRQSYLTLVRLLNSSPHVTVVPASQELFDRGHSLFAARPDKEWSLTDCTSFIIMQDRAIDEALPADHHFEQAGFVALLKP